MRRHSLLISVLLPILFLITLGSISRSYSVMAQAGATEGTLTAVDAKGSAGQCPLKHTEVKTEISGFLARTVVTQQFENPFTDKIEAVYTFPLPPAAAVDDMTIVVGERIVKGKIMRRDDAQATYDEARANGKVAALLKQQRPNIFTQAVANILPGQKINVTISYVETLEYDEGSYEWSFPMVVGPRYIPAAVPSDKTAPEPGANEANPVAPVTDAAEISPSVMPEGERAGHDISIEVNIDAGVPLVDFQSRTHDIDALQPGSGKAIVRLRDQATIPNKDFVLKYTVAGSQIEDALLLHRKDKDGFFTFILQPPQRVTAPDVTPKELVFVLDTSGSMGGFPIEKAKETMNLALDGLYPQDTFNVITFAGETKILFSEPVPATPENLRKARNLLASVDSDGGTEMMKAIRAALDPSDAQDHVRITCFLTDGQVGNDAEIISEVQKHPRARVFAMGFGSAPNRYLLDKITQDGRGEAEYVLNDDTSGVAKRFHERVRNPLLTDVSVEWVGLSVSDVYPKIIPDLFSAKPVVISGRFAGGGKGLLRLKGMMSGREFVREIPVEFPEEETGHDVLATLWARRKIDDLMGADMTAFQVDPRQADKKRNDLKTEIENLGLTYRLLTQFTSFVAVEDSTITDGLEPRRVDVPVESTQGGSVASVAGSGGPACSVCATVTVTAVSATVNTTGSSVSTTVTEGLPFQSRDLQSLMLLAPGTVAPRPTDSVSSTLANISVNGQPPRENSFLIDGVNGDFGIAPGGQSPGASLSGSTPPLTATGAANPIWSVSALQEVTLNTYGTAPESGRNSGAQIAIVTKSGTNYFHGSSFFYFGHDALDASDWFANSRTLAKPRHRLSDFGGTFGGPIQRDHWFFFSSYEGLRLRQPVVALTDVPSLASRSSAPANLQPLLNLYPLPNRADRGDGFAEFASSFANQGRHDSSSLRVDGAPKNNLNLSAYYQITDSSADERGAGGLSLNTLNRLANRAQTITGSASFALSSTLVAEVKANYGHFTSRSAFVLDAFGGATLPAFALAPDNALLSVDLNARSTRLLSGEGISNTQRQFNLLGAVTKSVGAHTIKIGGDYRRIFPIIRLRPLEQSALFDGVAQALTGSAARVNFLSRSQSQRPVFHNTSVYGQDEWRLTPKLTLTYGTRWEVNPAPNASDKNNALAVTQIDEPASLTLAPPGTRLWQTTYGNFAPSVGVAYSPLSDSMVIRGHFGLVYAHGDAAAGDAYADSYPFLNGQSQFNVPFAFAGTPPPSSNVITVPFAAFDPHLRQPYLIEWNASVQQLFGSSQSLEASYLGNAGKRLSLTNTFLHQNSIFDFLRLTNNGGSSNYNALQVQFTRQFANPFGARVSYTWAKSTSDFSEDRATRALLRSTDLQDERGPSDFDIRHTLTGYVFYDLPTPFASGFRNALTRKWRLDTAFSVRSAPPVDVVYAIPTSFGYLYARPDVIAGSPLYLNDPGAAGGRRINAAAFSVPQALRQGTLGRNALRGFPLSQLSMALRRRFSFTESVKLTLGAEANNIFNHPNFAAPAGNEATLGTIFTPGSVSANPTFGQSFTNAARSPWGIPGSSFGSSYYAGGARTMKLSVKLEF
jgi:Ca-activated chloride channel homolog